MSSRKSSSRSPRQPSYRLHKARGSAVVTIDGKNHYLGKYDSPESHEKYARLIAQWQTNGKELPARNAPEENGELSVSGLVLKYMNYAEGYYKNYDTWHQGEISNLSQAAKPLLNLYGRTRARDFLPEYLESIRESMIQSGLARTTINQRTTRIKRIFRWGGQKGLVPAAIYHGLRAVEGLKRGRTTARETAPVKPAPDDDIQAACLHLNKHVRAMVQVQELAGMRPQDIRNLRTCDLDMTSDIWVYRPWTHKNEHHNQERLIAIGPKAQAILMPFLKPERSEVYVFIPREAVETVRAEKRQGRKTPLTPSERNRTRKPSPKRKPGEQYTKDAYRYL